MSRVIVVKVPGWTQTLEQSTTSASTVDDGRRIELDYFVENVTGVYDNSAGTGTNYWTEWDSGSDVQKKKSVRTNEKYIILPVNTSLAASTTCFVTYRVPTAYREVVGGYGINGGTGIAEMFSYSGDNVFAAEMTDRNTGFPEKIVLDPQVGGMVVKSVKTVTDGTNISVYIYDDPGTVTADTYATANQDADQAVGNGTVVAAGQSFAGNSGILTGARLWLKAVSSPTGTAVCKLYASTGSDPNRTPTGSALATSGTVDVSTIGATYENVDFTFTDEYTVASGTTYFMVLEYTGDSSNYLHWGTDTSSPTHASNNFATNSGSWSAAATTDGCFFVYTTGDPTDAHILWKSETINGIDIDDRPWVIDYPITEIWVGYVDTGANATPASTNISLRGAPLV